MKVAYLVNQYPKPSHSFIRREIHGLEAIGVEVVRYSIRTSRDPLVDELDHAEAARTHVILGASVLALLGSTVSIAVGRPIRFLRALYGAGKLGWHSSRGLLYHAAYLVEACALVRCLDRDGVEHLHAHFATNSTTVALLCRALGGPPFSFTFHGPEIGEFRADSVLTKKIEHARFVVTISLHGRSQLYRRSGLDQWPKIELVRCGLDASFLEHPSTPVPATPRLVSVARLDVEKGHLCLLEAASRLAHEGLAFDLVLVGDGPARGEIEAAILRLGLCRHVRLVGWKSSLDVRAEILAARALVLASFDEGLPVVFMEALALERPVIGTFLAGTPELIEAGIGGWLVPAGSVDELAGALRTVLGATPEVLQEIARRGRDRVCRDHDAGRSALRLAELFAKRVPDHGR